MGQVELRVGFGRTLAVAGLLGMAAGTAVAQSGVTVSNVTAAQRNDNSKLVDIYYNLSASGPCTVWPVISGDGGVTWNVPAQTFIGALGPNVSSGNGRHIVWDAGANIPGKVGSFRTRVFADDGSALTNMVLVPGGTFPYQRALTAQVFVATFLIDKYEVTNQRYAEFLNDADPQGQYWTTNQEITRNGTPPNVYYAPWPGKQNYPVRFVSALDAEAFAAWLSAREGRSYRLPSEQEWEKAAAWDSTNSKFWNYGFQADSISCQSANYSNCVSGPIEVGHFNGTLGSNDARSYYGCYDMTGNVWEWTSSNYSGPAYCPISHRMVRGGSWGAIDADSTTFFRCNHYYFGYTCIACTVPNNRVSDIGFRLALDAQ